MFDTTGRTPFIRQAEESRVWRRSCFSAVWQLPFRDIVLIYRPSCRSTFFFSSTSRSTATKKKPRVQGHFFRSVRELSASLQSLTRCLHSMAPSGWAIPEQRAWLESRVPDFQQAQRSNKTQAFRHEVHSAFFEKWPNPASEVISEPSGQKLLKSKSKTGSASLPLLPIAEWTELRKKVSLTNL